MAGEVPIAIIKVSKGCKVSPNEMKQLTTCRLGPAFAPKLILNLENDLDMTSFPMTASGKVRKVELRQIVRDYLAQQQNPALDRSATTVDLLIIIWTRISGADVLLPGTSIQAFADSLMMMQLSGIVKSELGKDVTVEDFKSCESIQDQADLIDLRTEYGAGAEKSHRSGPPTLEDVTHARGNPKIFRETQREINSALSEFDLAWSDVEDVMPLPDWEAIFLNCIRPQSWNLRWSYHAPVNTNRLEAAVKETLALHPTLRSIAVRSEGTPPLLVTIRPSEEWFDKSVTTGWKVDTKEDLGSLLLGHTDLDRATFPGPLFKVHVASVESDGTSGLVIVASHAIIDATMTKLWLDDMAAALSGENKPVYHAFYNDYAAAYSAHRTGLEAQRGIEYWAQKLQGVGSLPAHTYWPAQRAPEWFKGCDYGWKEWYGRKCQESLRSVSQMHKVKAQKGIRRLAKVRDIAALKSKHNVPVFMLVKAAIALLNVNQTGGREAVFGTTNAARTWPFSSDYSIAERSRYTGNPLDISGCTVEYILDRVQVDTSDSVLSFMRKVTAEEECNSAHAHAPFLEIMDRLRHPVSTDDSRSPEQRHLDADSILSLVRRQSFNWLPTSPNAQQHPHGLKMLDMTTRMDNGLTITGFLADDKRSVALSMAWDAEHLTMIEAECAIDELVALVVAMGQEDNWHKSLVELA